MNDELWQIAREIRAHPREQGGDLYHPLPFLEFQELSSSSSHRAAEKKWDLIQGTLKHKMFYPDVRVLDVGANAGFYAFSFAQLGSSVVAYEPHAHYARVGEQIAKATELDVSWHQKPIASEDLQGETFDVALMLSVFQWMSRGKERLDAACRELETIADVSRVLFFELGCNHGKSAIHTRTPALLWLWRLLQEHTGGKEISFLGVTTPWGGRRYRYVLACSDIDLRLSRSQRLVTKTMKRAAALFAGR